MTNSKFLTALVVCVALAAIYVLESAREGVTFTDFKVGPTPVTTLSVADASGPNVVVAHGFAGSREMMQGYGLALAQAGYRVHMFDFEGHGAHPLPMSGDVTRIEGTTQRLINQTLAVIDAVNDDQSPVSLLGHSMATDVLVRVAGASDQVGPLVLLSAFSQAVTASHPNDMLLISGQWEPPLRDFALRAARMVDPAAQEGDVVQSGEVIRAAKLAPFTEHVAILHSRAGRTEAVAWLNRAYERDTAPRILQTGWAFLALMTAITLLARPVAKSLIKNRLVPPKPNLSVPKFAFLLVVPMVTTPLVAAPLEIHFLSVLVADYLAIHLAIYGVISLIMLRWAAGPIMWGRFHPIGGAALILWGIGIFGYALDRYGANFFPGAERYLIITALCVGAIPFMLSDAMLAWKQSIWRRVALRTAFLISLGIAVAIDLEGLFFLIMIAPVIVLFFFVHGTMARAFGKETGPLTAGLAMGLILAWALGVSFPMFSA